VIEKRLEHAQISQFRVLNVGTLPASVVAQPSMLLLPLCTVEMFPMLFCPCLQSHTRLVNGKCVPFAQFGKSLAHPAHSSLHAQPLIMMAAKLLIYKGSSSRFSQELALNLLPVSSS